MSLTEYALIAFFIAVVLVSVVDAIRTPLLIKRLYRNRDFSDKGKVPLTEVSNSLLVEELYTENLYTGIVDGVELSQCKAWPLKRRKFTLSKKVRKHNRTPWSMTTVKTNASIPAFLALPTIVPEAVSYIGDGRSIEFPDDEEMESRYHVTTDSPDKVRRALTAEAREFLLRKEIIFIQQTESELVVRRLWSSDKVTERLEMELDIALKLYRQLG